MTKRKKDEVFLEDDYEDKDDSERLSVWDAAQIWPQTERTKITHLDILK